MPHPHGGREVPLPAAAWGGRFAPLAVSPAPVPPPPAQPTMLRQPAPHPDWLNYTANHQENIDAKQRTGWDLR